MTIQDVDDIELTFENAHGQEIKIVVFNPTVTVKGIKVTLEGAMRTLAGFGELSQIDPDTPGISFKLDESEKPSASS